MKEGWIRVKDSETKTYMNFRKSDIVVVEERSENKITLCLREYDCPLVYLDMSAKTFFEEIYK